MCTHKRNLYCISMDEFWWDSNFFWFFFFLFEIYLPENMINSEDLCFGIEAQYVSLSIIIFE